MFADFLPRNPNQGWASEAKPIPPEKKDLQRHIKQNQSQTLPGVYLFLAKESKPGMGEQSEANSSFETNTIRRPVFRFHISLFTSNRDGRASKANSYWNTRPPKTHKTRLATDHKPEEEKQHLQYIHKTIFISQPL